MTRPPSDLAGTVAALREAFDRSFANAPAVQSVGLVDLLALRVCGSPHAIRLSEARSVEARRRVVPIPAKARGFLGLAGVRGEVVPVFSLAVLLGLGGAPDAPTWLVLCGASSPIALAFSELEGCQRVPATSFHAREDGRATDFARDVVTTESGPRAVLDLGLIASTLAGRTASIRSREET